MTTDEILTVLKEATDNFDDIAVKPTDDGMYHMNRTLLPILLKIPYDQVEATHNLSGIIPPYAKYTTNYGMAFKLPTRPGLYFHTITAPMSDTYRCKYEATNSARKEYYQLYKAEDMGTMRFLTPTVYGTWYW